MSWLKDLIPFATGFIKGFASEYNRPAPASGPSPLDDFYSRMMSFGKATGLGEPTFQRNSAGFVVPVQGVPYPVVLTPVQEVVLASAASKVEFPYGIPADLNSMIDRLNAGITTGCYYKAVNDETGASFYALMRCRLHELSLPVFQGMLVELTSRIVALDRMLKQNGYGQ